MRPLSPGKVFTESEVRLVQYVDAWPGDRIMTCFGYWTMLSTGRMVFTPTQVRPSVKRGKEAD